jgi:cytochrome bd-type quinol oxidase subunit 2
MDLTFITELYIPMIMVLCLVIGYITKKWIKDIDNKYIPTLVTIVGAVCAVITQGLSFEAVVAGAVTGLASTGLHQMFSRLVESSEKGE